jgi:hypothetical protein
MKALEETLNGVITEIYSGSSITLNNDFDYKLDGNFNENLEIINIPLGSDRTLFANALTKAISVQGAWAKLDAERGLLTVQEGDEARYIDDFSIINAVKDAIESIPAQAEIALNEILERSCPDRKRWEFNQNLGVWSIDPGMGLYVDSVKEVLKQHGVEIEDSATYQQIKVKDLKSKYSLFNNFFNNDAQINEIAQQVADKFADKVPDVKKRSNPQATKILEGVLKEIYPGNEGATLELLENNGEINIFIRFSPMTQAHADPFAKVLKQALNEENVAVVRQFPTTGILIKNEQGILNIKDNVDEIAKAARAEIDVLKASQKRRFTAYNPPPPPSLLLDAQGHLNQIVNDVYFKNQSGFTAVKDETTKNITHLQREFGSEKAADLLAELLNKKKIKAEVQRKDNKIVLIVSDIAAATQCTIFTRHIDGKIFEDIGRRFKAGVAEMRNATAMSSAVSNPQEGNVHADRVLRSRSPSPQPLPPR